MSARIRRVTLGMCCLTVLVSLPALGLAASAPRLTSGVYRATVADGTPVYHATWNITVSASGKISGRSHWPCCPGKRVDPLTGHATGTHVVIVRHCTGKGAGFCLQTYTGTVGAGGTVKGHWTGTGVGQPKTFVLTRV